MKAVVYGVNPLGWLTCKWLRHLWRGCLTSPLAGVSLHGSTLRPCLAISGSAAGH